ncbi:MAG: hypothetical protein ABEH65_01795, partial [Halobacteriales archaeon]
TNGGWPTIYDYYWDTLIPVTLFLWAVMIGLVIFFESTSHLFSGYHRSKLKKRAFSGLLGILSWWWIAAISLRFMNALTGFLVPNLADISLFETLSFSTMGVLGLVVSLSIDLILFILIAVLYFTRQVVLYLFVLLMPLLIVFWVPGVGPFALASRFMKKLAGFYVPFLFMTVPVALLFRLGDLLGTSFGLSMGGIGAWLIALVIPLVAVVSPLILFWQAGALFFIADRAARHTSRQRVRSRIATARTSGQTAAHGGRNFARGVRGERATTRDGQFVFDSGRSRAHAAGSRLNAGGSTLRTILRDGNGGSDRGGNGGQSGGGNHTGETTGTNEEPADGTGRSTDFDTLRPRTPKTNDESTTDTDRTDTDRPWYIN